MNPKNTLEDRLREPFQCEKWRASMRQLGTLYPKGEEKIPLAQFLIYQMTYWQAGCPIEAPGLVFVGSNDCDPSALNILVASQSQFTKYDREASPDDELVAATMSFEMERLKKAPPPGGIVGSQAFARVQSLKVHFWGLRSRPFTSAWSPHIGILHDYSGNIRLEAFGVADQDCLLRRLSQPDWLDDPKGLFLRCAELKPVRVSIVGTLPFDIVNGSAAEGIWNAELPLVFTTGPTKERLEREELQDFLLTSDYLSGWLQATRIQPRASSQYKLPGLPLLDFKEFDQEELANPKVTERFDEIFGPLEALPEKHRSHLKKTLRHLWSYAYWFSEVFVGFVRGDRLQVVQALTDDFREGVEQLLGQHLKIVDYFAIGEEQLSALAAKVLIYLRQAEEGATGRQLCRKFSVSAGDRDRILKELTEKGFATQKGNVSFARPLGAFCKALNG